MGVPSTSSLLDVVTEALESETSWGEMEGRWRSRFCFDLVRKLFSLSGEEFHSTLCMSTWGETRHARMNAITVSPWVVAVSMLSVSLQRSQLSTCIILGLLLGEKGTGHPHNCGFRRHFSRIVFPKASDRVGYPASPSSDSRNFPTGSPIPSRAEIYAVSEAKQSWGIGLFMK